MTAATRVTVVFGGAVILGTRARKTYSKSFGAFSSINYPVLGVVQEGRLVPYILPPAGPAPRFFHALNQRVSLVKLIPGLSPAYLAFALAESDGVLVESFGVGGVPAGDQGQFYDLIRQAVDQGKIVVVTTQVQNEGSDLAVYNVGHRLKRDLGVLESYDMTIEAAVAKLMVALAQTRDSRAVAGPLLHPCGTGHPQPARIATSPVRKTGDIFFACAGVYGGREGGHLLPPGKIGRRRGLRPMGAGVQAVVVGGGSGPEGGKGDGQPGRSVEIGGVLELEMEMGL